MMGVKTQFDDEVVTERQPLPLYHTVVHNCDCHTFEDVTFGLMRIVGTAADKASLVSFTVAGVHPHDLGTILDEDGIAIRTGHHCAMPVMDFFKVAATARASFAFYNTVEEIDRLAAALERARSIFV